MFSFASKNRELRFCSVLLFWQMSLNFRDNKHYMTTNTANQITTSFGSKSDSSNKFFGQFRETLSCYMKKVFI